MWRREEEEYGRARGWDPKHRGGDEFPQQTMGRNGRGGEKKREREEEEEEEEAEEETRAGPLTDGRWSKARQGEETDRKYRGSETRAQAKKGKNLKICPTGNIDSCIVPYSNSTDHVSFVLTADQLLVTSDREILLITAKILAMSTVGKASKTVTYGPAPTIPHHGILAGPLIRSAHPKYHTVYLKRGTFLQSRYLLASTTTFYAHPHVACRD